MKYGVILLCFASVFVMGCQKSEPVDVKDQVEIVETIEAEQAETIQFGDIQVSELEQVMNENPDLILLDVRTQMENEEDAIPNSIVIPVQELQQRIDELDKEETYLVYCRSGNRSGQAMGILEEQGFTKLYHMLGGMIEYRKQNPKD